MKPGISKPAKYAETIGQRKFVKLSSRRQHELLAMLARNALEHKDYKGFIKRYREMQSWVELDQYSPPDWLSDYEVIQEYVLFHNSFSNNPLDASLDDNTGISEQQRPSWQSVFDVTVVLDQVRSPYNAGSVLRLIDNFGFRRLVHNSSWLRLDHPQLRKAARGCEKWIPVEFKADLVEWLKSVELPIIGIEMDKDSIPLEEWAPVGSCILIVGNEVYGIGTGLREMCTYLIKIPMFGYKKSMNLHHALAIIAHKISSTCYKKES